jgi:sulfite exporter TauE/SafE
MPTEIFYLILTTISICCLHTITGPDHYLPFIALSKTKSWTVNKTVFWTLLCGLGHVLGSLVLGSAGIALGWSLSRMGWLENVRGSLAGWIMFSFGLAYFAYAFVQLRKNKLHKHFDVYGNEIYVYEHRDGEVVYPSEKRVVTPWIIFIIFLLGPCEPLIPLLSFPAAKHSFANIIIIISVFTLVTLIIMVTMVLMGYYGISFLKLDKLEKYSSILAGVTVILCGVGMLFLNW